MSTSRPWVKRLLLALAAPALFLGLLELGLALADVNAERYAGLGDNGRYWLPWPGDVPGYQRVFPRRYTQFPEPLPIFVAEKPANGWRVFIFGESTVKGLPYEVGCFTDWVRLRASAMLPDRTVEVVNAGNVGWHATDIRLLLQECLEYQPDVLVWMVGNNEFVPDNVLRLRDETLHPVRHALREAAFSLRTTRWLGDRLPAFENERKDIFDRKHSEERPIFGPELPLLKQRFLETTEGAVADARAAGVPIVLCTMPRNLRQWPPNSSSFSDAVHADPALRARWDEAYEGGLAALDAPEGQRDANLALKLLGQAATIDSTPAKLHYALARAHEALGQTEAARARYVQALDQDAGPSRCQDWAQAIIRDVAARSGAPLVDLVAAFDACGKDGMTGHELLCDAMHPNLTGHELIGKLVLETLERELGVPFDRSRDVALETGRVQLGITEQQRSKVKAAEALNLVKLAVQAGVVNEMWEQAHAACKEALALDVDNEEVKGGLGLLEALAGNRDRARVLIEGAMERNAFVMNSYVFFWKTEPPYQKALDAAGVDMAAVEASLTPKQRLMLENRMWHSNAR